MTALTFDTLKYANTLKKAGVSQEQAEAQAGALSEVLEVNLKELATKGDLRELERATKAEFTLLRAEMRELEQRMTIKLGAMLVVAVGAVATLVKLL